VAQTLFALNKVLTVFVPGEFSHIQVWAPAGKGAPLPPQPVPKAIALPRADPASVANPTAATGTALPPAAKSKEMEKAKAEPVVR
jgi:hypothetical protein